MSAVAPSAWRHGGWRVSVKAMARVRPAAVCGSFYPEEGDVLREMVAGFLAAGRRGGIANPKAVIAPHAGYRYSGSVAGSAFRAWSERPQGIGTVVVMGPSHWVDFDGLAVVAPAVTGFATPLGVVPVAGPAVEALLALPQVVRLDAAHAQEHAIEVELPFLQVALGDFALIPLVVGRADGGEVCEVIARATADDAVRVVISSDLSHYLDHRAAVEQDRETARRIERLAAREMGEERACGYRAVRGLLEFCAAAGLAAETVDLRNSGDTGAGRERVVGYGAFACGVAAVPGPVPDRGGTGGG